jgi:hypothetical protein
LRLAVLLAMKKNVAIALLSVVTLALLYQSLRAQMRVYRVRGNAQTIVLLRDSALASTNVAQVVENVEYILWLTPGRDGKSKDSDFAVLLDTLTNESVDAMIAHLKQITGRDLGSDPKAWIGAYAKNNRREGAP